MYEQSYMYPPPATGPGYGQPYHTNADSRLGAFHISPHPSTSSVPNYENVELGKTADWNRDRTVTSTSAGNVAEVASRVGAMQINSNPNPHASREVTPTLTSVPPISTNAESQYQTSQQVQTHMFPPFTTHTFSLPPHLLPSPSPSLLSLPPSLPPSLSPSLPPSLPLLFFSSCSHCPHTCGLCRCCHHHEQHSLQSHNM